MTAARCFRPSFCALLLTALLLPSGLLAGELSAPPQGLRPPRPLLGQSLRFDPWASALAASVARMASMRLFDGDGRGPALAEPAQELAAALLLPAGRGWLHLERSAAGELSVRFQTQWD